MKIISWNVNGLRAVLNKGFSEYILKESPDILCLQETKAHREQVDLDIKDLGFNFEYWNSAEKKGYSGVAIFSKDEPLNVTYGMASDKHDNEGRVITLEFKKFFLVTVYTPNSKRDLLRLDYRQNEWDKDFLDYLNKFKEVKDVVVCGDMNVAPEEIDLKNPKTNRRNAGFTDEEREGFRNYLQNGYIDVFRKLYPEKIQYTWWSYMGGARAKNIGWRIDHFLVNDNMSKKVKDCVIYDQITGSDHCPISLFLKA